VESYKNLPDDTQVYQEYFIAHDSSVHGLSISMFTIALKIMYGDTYLNEFWRIVVQGMFSLLEMNQMEREMCSYLEWKLTVDNLSSNFEVMVTQNFFFHCGSFSSYLLLLG
jgi:hypothetical protein